MMPLPLTGQEEFVDEKFSQLKLKDELIAGKKFLNCVFQDCIFQNSKIRGCHFIDAKFKGCNLNMVEMTDSIFRDTQFVNCQMMGIDWTRADWESSKLGSSLSFEKCQVNYAIFFGLRLKKLQLKHCIARECDFTQALLTESDFARTDLAGSRFIETDLSGADFRDAVNYHIDARINKIKGAKFSLPEAINLLHSLDIVLDE